jgi:hypothetical protein
VAESTMPQEIRAFLDLRYPGWQWGRVSREVEDFFREQRLAYRPNLVTGDFDGNGRTDLVWRNASTGQTAIWLMNGLSMASGAIVLANTNWEPTHVADFDGNGKSDIVWRNLSTGDTSVWLMNGLAMASGGSITNAGSAVVTTGDYDGNGKADIVWHNSATGTTEMRLMNGLPVSSSAVLLVSTDWSVRP